MYGIATTACIPIRKKPGESFEMVSQILFGETYEILEKDRKFTKIKLNYDGYTGWISNESVCETTSDTIIPEIIISAPFSLIEFKNNSEACLIPGGSAYTFDRETSEYRIDNKTFTFKETPIHYADRNVFNLAKNYLNAPYLWGGRTIMGIDCSGLVQIVFKMKKIKLPRDASQQIKLGQTIENLSKASKGDLAFFSNQAGNITHVGILDGNGKIIHSSGRVKIDIITEIGILDNVSDSISHKLYSIKRIET